MFSNNNYQIEKVKYMLNHIGNNEFKNEIKFQDKGKIKD
jgi:hypothetical protein